MRFRYAASLLCALLFMSSLGVRAQVGYSVSNLLRLGDGRESSGGLEPKKEYIENLANVRLYVNDFTIGFRYLYDNPPEFGPKFQGIKKRYVEFARSGLNVVAGDYYTLYGRGLAMNLFENRGINYDTGLDGLRASYTGDAFNAIMSLGTLKYTDLIDQSRVESYAMKSANIELKPFSFLRVGASYVYGEGMLPHGQTTSRVRATVPEFFLIAKGGGFDFYVNVAQKRTDVEQYSTGGQIQRSFHHEGDKDRFYEALYASLSYAGEGIGVAFEYKDYRFDIVNQIERNPNRDTRMLPFQNPPVLFKEHSFTLLTRAPHIIDFNDEVGMQVDAFYQAAPDLTVNVNGSVASRHQKYAKVPNTNTLRAVEETIALPQLTNGDYAPFWEIYLDGEWYFTPESFVRVAFNHRRDVTNDSYNFAEDHGVLHTVIGTTLPVRLEYALDEHYAVAVDAEYQYVYDSQIKLSPKYHNRYFGLTLSHAPDWSATVRMEHSTNVEEPSGKQFWIAGEMTYRLGNAHTMSISYGSERGGLVCTSGICRQLNPFNGLRLTLLTQW